MSVLSSIDSVLLALVDVAAAHHGVTHVGELRHRGHLSLAFALRVVVGEVLDLLLAASGGGEHDGEVELALVGVNALLLDDLVGLVADLAALVALEVDGHGGGRVAAGGDLELLGVPVVGAAHTALVVLGELEVGVSAGGGVEGRVGLLEYGEGVAELVGGSGVAHDLHAFVVAEGRGGALVGGDLVEGAAADLALVVLALDHGDVAGTGADAAGRGHGVDRRDGDDENGDEDGDELGHFSCFLRLFKIRLRVFSEE